MNTITACLRINHKCVLIVHAKVRVGENCNIHQMVNIGEWDEKDAVLTIGNNVFIGSGAKLFGKITITDNCKMVSEGVEENSYSCENYISNGNTLRRSLDDAMDDSSAHNHSSIVFFRSRRWN